jgi:uncharacterized protein with HEPN domain
MRRREVLKCLFDIAEACEAVAEFMAGRSRESYLADRMLRSAVERQLMIVGEALRQAVRLDAGLADAITDTRLVISFRNRLVHGYSLTDHDIVWAITQTSLPQPRREVTELLAGNEPAAPPG